MTENTRGLKSAVGLRPGSKGACDGICCWSRLERLRQRVEGLEHYQEELAPTRGWRHRRR
ncbi:MAG: hypothetical protein K2G78_03975 [Muribaculaceae bacterium]|nr:hypothetical protein [Muribaculaceae bacterium]